MSIDICYDANIITSDFFTHCEPNKNIKDIGHSWLPCKEAFLNNIYLTNITNCCSVGAQCNVCVV